MALAAFEESLGASLACRLLDTQVACVDLAPPTALNKGGWTDVYASIKNVRVAGLRTQQALDTVLDIFLAQLQRSGCTGPDVQDVRALVHVMRASALHVTDAQRVWICDLRAPAATAVLALV